jgi:hypothetical protein
MNPAQTLWRQQHWPIRSGVGFASGVFIPLRIVMHWESHDSQIHIEAESATQIEDLVEFQKKEFTQLLCVFEKMYPEIGVKIQAGEAAYGSDGFVAAADNATGDLIWIAFFDCSNPFETAEFADGFVVGVTNLGDRWRFPFADPQMISVEKGPWKGKVQS